MQTKKYSGSKYKNFAYDGRDLESMAFANNYHFWIYEEIKRYLGHQIAEIGCGQGNFTDYLLRDSECSIHSFEPCLKMYSKNKHLKNKQVSVTNDNFENLTQSYSDYFDSVVFINVLEHIEHDSHAIKKSYEILNKKGKIIIFVPAIKFLMSNFDRSVGHYRRYCKKSLQNLLIKQGFHICECSYFDSLGIIPWLIFMKVFKFNLSLKSVKIYDSFVVPWLRKIERFRKPPIGKNLLIVANK